MQADLSLPFCRTDPYFRPTRHHLRDLMVYLTTINDQEAAAEVIANFTRLANGENAEQCKLSRWAKYLLRDFVLSYIDAPIQDIYRRYLARAPLPAGVSLLDRLAHFAPVEQSVRDLVAKVDWSAFAHWLGLGPDGKRLLLIRLSSMSLHRRMAVSFILSYHCPAACRHCTNLSGPTRKEPRLPLDRMLDLIRQMPEYGVGALEVTGGEPFLQQDDLMTLIAAAGHANLSQLCLATNGFWAQGPDCTRKILQRLRQAGFMSRRSDVMWVSNSVYHQEFIDPARIACLAQAYHDEFSRKLMVRFTEDAFQDSALPTARDRLIAAGLNPDLVEFSSNKIYLSGRGLDFRDQSPEQMDRLCIVAGKPAFSPDGRLMTCCGYHNEVPGMAIGLAGTAYSLGQSLHLIANDGATQLFRDHPVKSLLEQADGPVPELARADRCAPCRWVFATQEKRRQIENRFFLTQKHYPFWLHQ